MVDYIGVFRSGREYINILFCNTRKHITRKSNQHRVFTSGEKCMYNIVPIGVFIHVWFMEFVLFGLFLWLYGHIVCTVCSAKRMFSTFRRLFFFSQGVFCALAFTLVGTKKFSGRPWGWGDFVNATDLLLCKCECFLAWFGQMAHTSDILNALMTAYVI